ncbi:MAG: phosphate ABC transporter permease subunit PstC, partial [Pseudomonadota bacterium]
QLVVLRSDTALGDSDRVAHDELRQLVAARYAELAQLRVYGIAALAIGLALVAAIWTYMQSGVSFRARNRSERIIRSILWTCAALAVLTTIGIVLSLVEQTYVFFTRIDWQVDNFFFGTTWSPLAGVHTGIMEPDKVGWLPLITGTLMITMIALLVAVPIGLMAAIYLADYASPSVRSVAKPVLEILAGIPTVVYGFFAAITVAPVIRGAGESLGLSVASESALAAGIVMGIMIIPFISSLSDDVLNAVPQSLRDGSYGLGATKAETIRRVVLPAALPGIISAVILAFSRAVGETMIVVMAAGQGPNLTWNPLEAVTTVTVQIVLLIVGDAEADFAGPPAFTLGFALFTVTLVLNIIALRIVRKYRELYD